MDRYSRENWCYNFEMILRRKLFYYVERSSLSLKYLSPFFKAAVMNEVCRLLQLLNS